MPSTPRKVPSGHGTKSSIFYLHSPGVRPTMIVRLSGHPLVRDSLSSPRTGLQRRRVRRVYCLRRCKAGSPSNFMFLSNSVWLPYKCCAPWLLRPIMTASHVSNEYEKSECFYIHTPSRINELTYLRGRGFRSKPRLPPFASVHQSAFNKGPFHHGQPSRLLLSPF